MINFKHIKHWNKGQMKTFISGLTTYLHQYYKEFNNPLQAIRFKIGQLEEINLDFKDEQIPTIHLTKAGKHILTSYINSKYNHDEKYIDLYRDILNQLNTDNEYVDFKGIKVPNKAEYVWLFFEFYGSYDLINYENRTVIDIGSNIGDTSLNFANHGATVYAYEVVPYIHEISKDLLELNPQYDGKIYYFNKAVASKKGTITISYDEEDANIGGASIYSDEEKGFEIETLSIQDILDENNIEADVLKMDCEGCEYNIILTADLTKFKDVILEYHNVEGHTPQELVDKLKKEGFTVKQFPDRLINNLGIIHAYK